MYYSALCIAQETLCALTHSHDLDQHFNYGLACPAFISAPTSVPVPVPLLPSVSYD